MEITMRRLAPLLCTAFAILVLAAPASAFKCSSGAGGSCACQGRADCKDMRRSEMCKGDLTCGKGKCSCTAALVADPGVGGGAIGGAKGMLNKGLLSAQ
jgi:hypothetical protein